MHVIHKQKDICSWLVHEQKKHIKRNGGGRKLTKPVKRGGDGDSAMVGGGEWLPDSLLAASVSFFYLETRRRRDCAWLKGWRCLGGLLIDQNSKGNGGWWWKSGVF